MPARKLLHGHFGVRRQLRHLLAQRAELVVGGVGYLLKDRVGQVEQFVDAFTRVAAGGTVVDPEVVRQLLRRRRDPLERLTPREREVLALLAEGRTNREIGETLFMAEKTASVHVSRILAKLGVRGRTEAAAVAHRLGIAA